MKSVYQPKALSQRVNFVILNLTSIVIIKNIIKNKGRKLKNYKFNYIKYMKRKKNKIHKTKSNLVHIINSFVKKNQPKNNKSEM